MAVDVADAYHTAAGPVHRACCVCVGCSMAAKIAGDVVKVCHMTSIGIDDRASHFLSDNGESYHHEGLGGSAQNSAAIAVVAGLLVVVPLFFTVYDCGAAFMGIFVSSSRGVSWCFTSDTHLSSTRLVQGPVILAAAILMCWMIPKKYALKLTDPDGDYEYLDAKEGKKRVITSKTQFPGAIQRAQQAVTDSAESWRCVASSNLQPWHCMYIMCLAHDQNFAAAFG